MSGAPLHGLAILRREARPGQDDTETRPVMVQSIVALAERRHPHAHELALSPRQGAAAMHQLLVELVVLAHDGGMDRVNLDDVVGIGDPVLGRQPAGGDVGDECRQGAPAEILSDCGVA